MGTSSGSYFISPPDAPEDDSCRRRQISSEPQLGHATSCRRNRRVGKRQPTFSPMLRPAQGFVWLTHRSLKTLVFSHALAKALTSSGKRCTSFAIEATARWHCVRRGLLRFVGPLPSTVLRCLGRCTTGAHIFGTKRRKQEGFASFTSLVSKASAQMTPILMSR